MTNERHAVAALAAGAAVMGGPTSTLTAKEVRQFIAEQLAATDLDGRSVCVVIPDGTRSSPLPLLLRCVREALAGRAIRITTVVALGTHVAMDEEALARHLGYEECGLEATYPGMTVVNHEWWKPETFVTLGTISAERVSELSGGLLAVAAEVALNRVVVDHDVIPSRRVALCVVARSGSHALHAASFGGPESAWAAAALISAQTHVRYLDAPVRRVVSLIPEKYEDIWTAAKGFYKLEPVVADGGEVVLYAPHVKEISVVHREIYDIGYHCRDYFVKQWDRFSDIHWGVLAHSTHLRGAGTYDEVEGERCRVEVTLVTSIPPDLVRKANLGCIPPEDFDLAAYDADPETVVVPNAGETLFRPR